MAYVYFNSSYVPCGFLIVRDGGNPYEGSDTALVQSDWDFPGIASSMGHAPCEECNETDGTVDCAHHGASDMISQAYDFIREHAGESFDGLDCYLPTAAAHE